MVERKGLPGQASKLEFTADPSLLVPPEHAKVADGHGVARLGARREPVAQLRRRINVDFKGRDVLKHRHLTGLGTAIQVQGRDPQVGNEGGEVLVAFVPLVAGGSDNTPVWEISWFELSRRKRRDRERPQGHKAEMKGYIIRMFVMV